MSEKRSPAPASFVPTEETAFVVEQQTNSSHECEAGDVVQPGESCTYPGTNLVFSVSSSGTGSLGFVSAGTRIEMINTTVNGVVISFVAEKQEDNSWLILRVGDDIHDPDADTTPTVTLALDSSSIGEDGGVATVTATLSEAASAAVTVSVSVSPDSGASSSDYTLSSNTTLTIAAGETTSTGTVTITAVDNDDDESDKTLTVSGAASGGGVSNPPSLTLTLADDDTSATDDYPASTESTGKVAVGGSVTGNIETAGDADWIAFDAKSGQNYLIEVRGSETDDGTLQDPFLRNYYHSGFASQGDPGGNSGFGKNSLDEFVQFADRTFYIEVTSQDAQGTGTYTLSVFVDDFGSNLISRVKKGSVEVGGSTTGNLETFNDRDAFAVELEAGKKYQIDLEGSATDRGTLVESNIYGIYDSDATFMRSYTVGMGTGGNMRWFFTPDKGGTYYIGSGGGVGPGTYTLSVSEVVESPPTVTLALDASSIGEDGGVATVTATLSKAASAAVTVSVSVSPDSGASSSDYTLSSNTTLTIAAGQTTSTGTVTITAVDNDVDAANKTVTVSGTASGGGVSNPSSQTLTIIDDDEAPPAPLMYVWVDSLQIGEDGGVATVTATLSGPASSDVEVVVSVSPEDGALSSDYTLSANRTLTIEAGQTTSTGTVTITAVDNDDDTPDKELTVRGTASGGASNSGRTTLTIIDDDEAPPAPLMYVWVDSLQIGEDGGVATVTATLSGPASSDVEVVVSVSPEDGALSSDYTLSANRTLTIEAGQTTSTGTVTITAVDNDDDTPDKELTVRGTASGGASNSGRTTLTIIDDDEAPPPPGVPTVALSLDSSAVDEDGGVATVTATLSEAASADVEVSVAVLPDVGASSSDYTLSSNTTLTIAAGQTTSTGTVTVTAVDNDLDAPNKTLTVSGTATGAGVSNPSSRALTIIDDEAPPAVSLALSSNSIDEYGGVATVTATLSGPSSTPVELTVSAAPGANTAAGDYTLSQNTTLTIAAGQTTSAGTVTITAVDDDVEGVDKSVTVSASVSSGNAVAPAHAILAISDDDDVTDDFAASADTAGAVEVEGAVTGRIGETGDEDWFRVLLRADEPYRISIEGRDGPGGALEKPLVRGVYDASGNRVGGVAGEGVDADQPGDYLFTPEADGIYYIAAAGQQGDKGTYLLSVGGDDFPASTETAGAVAVGGSVTGEIEIRGDKDWFRVNLKAGETYVFVLEGRNDDAGTLAQPLLHAVYDGGGKVRHGGSYEDPGRESIRARIEFTPDADGAYYIVAGAGEYVHESPTTAAGYVQQITGTYTLSVEELTDDFADSGETTGVVEVGGSATGEIGHHGDLDHFRVALKGGQTYRIQLKGTDSGTGNPHYFGLGEVVFSKAGTGELLEVEGTGAFDGPSVGDNHTLRLVVTPPEDGIYYIRVGDEYSNWLRRGHYTLSVEEYADDYSAGTDTKGEIEPGGSVTGEIGHRNDADWFRLTLKAGQTYRIRVDDGDGADHAFYARVLTDMRVHNADGVAIPGTAHRDIRGGINSAAYSVAFTPEEDGAYYLAIRGFGYSIFSQAGEYTVSVEEHSDDFAATVETTGTVEVGDSATGEIELPGDEDWFRVELKGGQLYGISLHGLYSNLGTLYSLRGVEVYDGEGNRIAHHNVGNTRLSRISFRPEEDGFYYISAAGAPDYRDSSDVRANTGTYTLSVTEDDDVPPQDNPPVAVEVGTPVTGEIKELGGRDWFSITLEAGKTYQIDLEGSSTDGGTLSDPYLRGVYNGDVDWIAGTSDQDGGAGHNSRVVFTPDTDGLYYVSAASGTSGRGTYTLSVAEYADDFITGTVRVGGSVTGEIETSGDEDLFRVILKAGETYVFVVEGRSDDAGTLEFPSMSGVYDGERRVLHSGSFETYPSSVQGRVVFTPDENGAYYIGVAAGKYAKESTGTYTLSADEYVDDFADSGETTGAVEVGGSATGEIGHYPDFDYFRVALKGGQTYRIQLKGIDSASGDPGPFQLGGVVFSKAETEGFSEVQGAGEFDGGSYGDNRTVRLVVTPPEDGIYYIRVGEDGSGFGSWSETRGHYTLSVEEYADDYSAGTDTKGEIEPGGSVAGELGHFRDEDWFRLTLKAGQTYRIRVDDGDVGIEPGLRDLEMLYTLMRVHNADGVEIPGTARHDSRNSNGGYSIAFTPGEDGAYYLAIWGSGSYFSPAGDYTVSVEEHTDDFTATVETTGVVEVGSSATGEFELPFDQDWFRVSLKGGQLYSIKLEGLLQGAGTAHSMRVQGIYDEDGADVPGIRNSNYSMSFRPDKDGFYYIATGALEDRSLSQRPGDTGTYTLSVTEDDDVLPEDNPPVAVEVGAPVTGEITDRDERDWFSITLEAGKTYQIDLEGNSTDEGTLHNPYLRGVYNGDGDWIAGTSDDDGGLGRDSRVVFAPDADGVYYISAASANTGAGTYTLSVAEHAEFSANTDTKGNVEVGVPVKSELHRGDYDWFRVTLKAGQEYRIDLEGQDTEGGTLRDPHLDAIYDAQGERIAGTHDYDSGTGLNALGAFRPDNDGVFYIAATSGQPNKDEGSYTLSVVEYADDFSADSDTTGQVQVGGSVDGAGSLFSTSSDFYVADYDWFRVTLKAGRTYQIELVAGHDEPGRLIQTIEGIHDADGDRIPNTSAEGIPALVTYSPDSDGTYFISVRGVGTYKLSVEDQADLRADLDTSGAVEAGGSVPGEIDYPGDSDWFSITLEAGKTYQIDLEGRSTDRGTLSSPFLQGVYDGGGNLIEGTSDDHGGAGYSSRVTFTPVADGVYYISAAGRYSDNTGTYTLSVAEYAEFSANTDTQGNVEVDGSVASALHRRDYDWIRVTLEAGKTYRIDLEGADTYAGTLDDPRLVGIYDADGDLIEGTGDDDGGVRDNSRLAFTPAADGVYYISAAGGYSGDTGTYTLSVVNTEFSANTDTKGNVEVGAPVTSELHRGDYDWFRVTLKAGQLYRIDLEGEDTEGGTLTDPHLDAIYDAEGERILGTHDYDTGTGLNALGFFRPDHDGVFFIAATSGQPNKDEGSYTLSVAEYADDFSADSDTTGRVQVGGSVAGTGSVFSTSSDFYVADYDWFRVTLKAGRTYQIELAASDDEPGPTKQTIAGIHDAGGDRILVTQAEGSPALVTYAPGSHGTYFISVVGEGAYKLSVADLQASPNTSGAVEVGGSATGEVHYVRDSEWFRITLEAGKTYQIDLEGRDTDGGTLDYPSIQGVYDSEGNELPGTSNEHGGVGRNSLVAFTPDADGVYYISATSRFDTGTYTLSVNTDFSANADTRGSVEVGIPVKSSLHPGDHDWFQVTLKAGQLYLIDLEGSPTRSGTLRDPHLDAIYDADGERIAGTHDYDSGRGLNARKFFRPDNDGVFFIAATSGQPNKDAGSYTLSVAEYTGEFSADSDTTGRVRVGGSTESEIEERGDVDWFRVELEGGKSYRIDMEGRSTGEGTLRDPLLKGIYTSAGKLITRTADNNDGIGLNSRVYFTPDADGVYFISAGPRFGGDTGTYTLSVAEHEDDFSAQTDTAGTVEVGGAASGAIEVNDDVDWFRVTLKAGQVYAVDLQGADTSGGTLADPLLIGIYDSSGAQLLDTAHENNSGPGTDSRVVFTGLADGVHFIAVAGASFEDTGTYTVRVEEYADDFTADIETAGAVEAGRASATGVIGKLSDEDWFRVSLKADQTYRIDLEGSATNGGSLLDPFLAGIFDSAGNRVGILSDDNSGIGLNSRITFTPNADGAYFIAARTSDDPGSYTLSVSAGDIPDNVGTRGRLAVNGAVSGRIGEAGDRDWYAVALEAGASYRIDLKGSDSGNGTLENPYLVGLYSSDGQWIAGTSSDDGGAGANARLVFSPDADGTYYVSAAGREGATGTYLLRVEGYADDFSANTETEGMVEPGGSADGEIGHSGDQDWFSVTLEAGWTYRIDLEGRDTGGGALENPALAGVYDAAGISIAGASDYKGGADGSSSVQFTPDADGVYFIAAADWAGVDTGGYTLSVNRDDFSATAETEGAVEVGGSVAGEIETKGDEDWFGVTLKAGQEYRIDFAGSGADSGELLLGVYDEDGDRLAEFTGANSVLVFTPDADGAYFLSAAASDSSANIAYTLSVAEHADDYSQDTATAGAVEVGGSAHGEIVHTGDTDWFRVALKGGQAYRVIMDGDDADARTLQAPLIRGIHDEDGNRIETGPPPSAGRAIGPTHAMTFTPQADGIYFIASTSSNFSSRGSYMLSVEEYADDFAAGTDTSGRVEVDGSTTGEIGHFGDIDWIGVTLKAGQLVRIVLDRSDALADFQFRYPLDISVLDATGQWASSQIESSFHERRGGEEVGFMPEADGTFYIQVGFGYVTVGTYTLSVHRDDFVQSFSTAGEVEVGSSTTGEIQGSTDVDWIRVELIGGKNYWFDMEGTESDAGALPDPNIRGILDADGWLAETWGEGGGQGRSRVGFTPESDGVYYVSVESNNLSSSGTYTLWVSDDESPATVDTRAVIEAGAAVAGEIETAGDQDWFRVTLDAGTTYRIDLEGSDTDAGTLADPHFRGIYDAGGEWIAGTADGNSGPGANSRLLFTPDTTGEFFLAAGAQGASTTGIYTLSVAEYSDDFAASVETTVAVAAGGSVAGEIGHSGDADWIGVSLRAGLTYRIELEGQDTDSGTLDDPYIRGIYDSAGNRIPETLADGGGVGDNAQLLFAPDSDGVYFVAATGAFLDDTGTYTLSVSEYGDDFAGSVGTAGEFEVGGYVTGEIGADEDRDWFRVTLEAGRAYRIDMEGSDSGGGTLDDPLLVGVYDAEGNWIDGTWADDGGVGKNSRLVFTPDSDGVYYISAGGRHVFNTGTYKLSVEEDSGGVSAAEAGGEGKAGAGGAAHAPGSAAAGHTWPEAGDTLAWLDLENAFGTMDDILESYALMIDEAIEAA